VVPVLLVVLALLVLLERQRCEADVVTGKGWEPVR